MMKTAALSSAELLDALHDHIAILDADGRILHVNKAWCSFCAENGGSADSSYVGCNYFDVCGTAAGDSSTEARIVVEGLGEVLQAGVEFRCEYPCHGPNERRWFELTAARITHNGAHHLVVAHRNITSRHVQQMDASRAHYQAEMLAALVATSNDPILSYDLDGRILTWNRAAQRLYGYTEDETIGRRLDMLYPENWPVSLEEYRDRIIAGEWSEFEAVRVTKDGHHRTVMISCAPVRGSGGDIIAISNIHRDITDARRDEEARNIVAQEIIHRAKNMLSVVNAILRQTARSATSIEDFTATFGERINSLSASTDLLVSSGWTSVSLDELAETKLRLYVDGPSDLVCSHGPRVSLLPQAVQVVGMALHELTTNSAKHGVLKTRQGRIAIDWRIDYGSREPGLRIVWKETDVEVKRKLDGSGFGQKVLTDLARAMLESSAEYELGEGFVQWTLTLPAEHFRVD